MSTAAYTTIMVTNPTAYSVDCSEFFRFIINVKIAKCIAIEMMKRAQAFDAYPSLAPNPE